MSAARIPTLAIAPAVDDGIVTAVEAGGGQVVEPGAADAIVWTNPGDPDGLKRLLTEVDASWVQLPFAGIEWFFDAGVIDDERTWTCTKGAYGPVTAEHALALMLTGARRIHVHVRSRTWRRGGLGSPERTLRDATVVIVGTKGIGAALSAMLQPLGARVIGVNRSGDNLEGAERTVTVDELNAVLPEADFVVVAASHTPATHHLFDAPALAAMSDRAWIVNVARGGLIDTEALVDALKRGAIGGAALDVTDPEPLPDGHELWDLEDCIITPHVANTWDMALPALRSLVQRNVRHFALGEELEGVIDTSLGY